MKKVNLIMTMLVMLTGVLTTNAQTPVYNTFSPANISDWTVTEDVDGTISQSGATSSFLVDLSNYTGYVDLEGTVLIEKVIDLSNLDSVTINFELVYGTSVTSNGNWDYDFEIFISNDNGSTYTSVYSNNVTTNLTNSFTVSNNSLLTINSKIKINIHRANLTMASNTYESSVVILNDFSIDGYESTSNVGINENDLSDNLEIYSYNKSVFLTSNENINTTVTVYNMNGQVVKIEKMNLSTSKSELNLYDVNNGMYIVMIDDGTNVMRKKLIIE